MQRSQLGTFLAGLSPACNDQIGQHANSTPVYRRTVGGWRPMPLSACGTALLAARGRSCLCPRWVSVADLHRLMVQEAA